MSNNQDHSKELVNKAATQGSLWVAAFGSIVEDVSKHRCTAIQELANVNGPGCFIGANSKNHIQDLIVVCSLNAFTPKQNHFTNRKITSLTKLLRSERLEISEMNVKVFLTVHALISRTKSLYHFSKRQFNT
jgi:hypothetical protein